MALQTRWVAAFAVAAGLLAVVPDASAQERRPFQHGTVGIEIAAAPLVEIWNLNDHREAMLEISASFWGAVSDRFTLGVAFQHAFVFQHTPGAFVQSISPLIRWRFADQPNWDWFIEAGPGVSWSDLDTPPRGTRFNYLFQAGAGGIRQVGRNQSVVVAYRFLHLSNNHREGRERNPDFEMMGIFVAWGFAF